MKKNEMLEMITLLGVLIIAIVLGGLSLKALDTHEKERALDRCYPNEIVVKYTSQGDKYYSCKVEK